MEISKNNSEWESIVSSASVARESKDNSQWVLGDLAVKARQLFGKSAIEELAIEINVNKSTLRRYENVSRNWPPSDRFDFLSHRHHQVLASKENRITWAIRAHDEQWSVERLQVELKKHEQNLSKVEIKKSWRIDLDRIGRLVYWYEKLVENGEVSELDKTIMKELLEVKQKLSIYKLH